MNAKMPQVQAAFEAAGFTDVKTVLSSGNVVFTAARATESRLERKAEAAMRDRLVRQFLTIVRPAEVLNDLLASNPYAEFRLAAGAKRVVTFLREEPKAALPLPVEVDGARILCVRGREVFTAYVSGPKGPVFMGLIERTFGKDLTTRTWETIGKVARQGGGQG
jgi:uncharacterized protein (DUF1697 family)